LPRACPRSALRGFDLDTGGAKFRWELPGKPGVLWYNELEADRALSMPLPK
jgi:hypothetical protein